MTTPKPHDPRVPQTTPEELGRQVNAILDEPVEGLSAELEQLSRAHLLLHHALQGD